MAVIELQGLSKWYGAGKSTLMNLVIGQLHPSRGSLRVLGQRVWDNPRVLDDIGFCPEGDPFWPNLTGRQFVQVLARLSARRGRRGWVRDAVAQAIAHTGMTPHADRPIKGYSKGMRQRIKIAQALVHRPRLLVLDEPLTGADPVGRHELTGLFRTLAEQGTDIIMSSHVLHEVEALTRQILLIDHGRIMAQGDLQDVRRQLREHPHTIRVRIDQPRRLAVRLADCAAVSGLRLAAADVLLVETREPDVVHALLPEVILAEGLNVLDMASVDEDLEAVFGYLTSAATATAARR